MVKEEIIQYVGVNELTPEEQNTVNLLVAEHYDKIKRKIKNLTSLVIHVKVYQKEGGKKKFSLHARCIAPTKTFESCKSHDWDLARALHKSFNDLKKQIDHTLRNDSGWKKNYE